MQQYKSISLFFAVTLYVAEKGVRLPSIGGRYEVEIDRENAVTKENLYVGGGPYSAPMVLRKQGGGSWTPYVIGRDYLGSITHIATTGGTLVEERSYDAWGRLRDPATNAAYDAASQPSLFLGRGWGGHEYLADFGLYNLNARLYDPVIGRFLSPDPYVQAPDNPANFNRYAYGLNNPLKYTDEDGEWIHIVIGAALGGIGNLIANWNNCKGLWQYMAAFGVGALTGAAVAATGGAVAAAGTTAWGVVANIGVGVLSGAANGATNDIIRQTGENFYGMENVDWKSVGISAAASGVAGGVSTGVGMSLAGINASLTINGITIKSPLITSFAEGSVLGGVGHVVGGTTAGMLSGNDLPTALHNSFNGIGASMLMGGAFSAASTTAYDLAVGMNPFTGERVYSKHAIERMDGRNISSVQVDDALSNPLDIKTISYDNQGRPSMTYVGREATVVVNPFTGKIVTVYGTHTSIVNKLIK